MSGECLVRERRPIEVTVEKTVRVLQRVDCSEGCWEFRGSHNPAGYARHAGLFVHRYVYAALVGPIPDDLYLDHLCRNTGCVNPLHLEPVTPRENVVRGVQSALKTHCAQGHPWVEENIWRHRDGRGTRKGRCKLCVRAANNRRYAERYAAVRRERRQLAKEAAS